MGDGVLLEFPSIVAAVECAVAIQKMMAERNAALPEAKRILYRIGVNLGDVLVEGDDILGDGVNVAARLEGIASPAAISLAGSAYEHVGGRIAAEFVEIGEQSLKNIAKPVRAYALSPEAIASARIEAPETIAAPASPLPAPDRREPPRLSLVVLPFANIGGDPEQEYFVDGVTESLTTDLSRISGAFVIGRSTAFTYKGKAVDLKQLGRELNVRYVLEGSVQRGGNRMRVNVQLIEAESGRHLWAERFDKPVADLFEMQDEIVVSAGQSIASRAYRRRGASGGVRAQPRFDGPCFSGSRHPTIGARLRTCWRRHAHSMKARSNWIPATLTRWSRPRAWTCLTPGPIRSTIPLLEGSRRGQVGQGVGYGSKQSKGSLPDGPGALRDQSGGARHRGTRASVGA